MRKKQITVEPEVPVADIVPKSLFERIGDYLGGKDWTFHSNAEKEFHSFHLRLRHGSVRVIADAAQGEGWSRILVYTTYPTFVPDARRAAICEALARINYSVSFGTFEMDFQDGEIRVKTWLESDGYLGEPLIDRAIRKSLDLSDQFQAALLAVAFGNAEPKGVVELGSSSEGETLQ